MNEVHWACFACLLSSLIFFLQEMTALLAQASPVICELLLGAILIVNIIELCVIASIFTENEPPELTDDMRAKLYS